MRYVFKDFADMANHFKAMASKYEGDADAEKRKAQQAWNQGAAYVYRDLAGMVERGEIFFENPLPPNRS